MQPKTIARQLAKICITDPILDLAIQIHQTGITQQQLLNSMRDESFFFIPAAARIALMNKFRDIDINGIAVARKMNVKYVELRDRIQELQKLIDTTEE